MRAGLTGTIPGRVVTRLPSRFEENLPVTRLARGPGSDDGVTDTPLLDVETFGANELEMWELAEATRQRLHQLAGTTIGGVLIDSVETATGPVEVDYGNPAVFRAVASYRVALRRHG
jgi:hypothetical protein